MPVSSEGFIRSLCIDWCGYAASAFGKLFVRYEAIAKDQVPGARHSRNNHP